MSQSTVLGAFNTTVYFYFTTSQRETLNSLLHGSPKIINAILLFRLILLSEPKPV